MKETLKAFLDKVAEDEELFREFAALAAKHGFDLTELDEEGLDQAAGGATLSAMRSAEMDSLIDQSSSRYEAAREQYRLAFRILTDHEARKSSIVQKLSG